MPAAQHALEPIDLPPDQSSYACVLLELARDSCRWPLGDPATSAFRFCGAPDCDGPYCQRHRRLAYQTPRDRGSYQAQRYHTLKTLGTAEVLRITDPVLTGDLAPV